MLAPVPGRPGCPLGESFGPKPEGEWRTTHPAVRGSRQGATAGEGPSEAERLGTGLDDVRPVGEPVDQRLTETRVRKDLSPLREWQVGGDNDRGPLRAIGDHLEQELGAEFGEWHVAELVEADQLDPLPTAERTAQGVGGAGLDQLVDQGG